MAVGYGKIPCIFDCLDNVDDEKQLTKIRINLYITNLSTILIDISSRKTKFLKGDQNATSASKNICFHKVIMQRYTMLIKRLLCIVISS